jgi:hydroxyacylglutathione hydrolase
MITVIPVPVFNDNYVWILHPPKGGAAIAIDPGDAVPVRRYLEAHDLQLGGILVTHHHGDHVGGIEDLAAHFGCTVYGPATEDIDGLDHPVGGGDHVGLGGLDLEVLDVPGHTRGHVAYFGGGLLFCGDTLFAGGCGRIFEGTPPIMHSSLSALAQLPPETLVYCAHEYTAANLRFALEVEPANIGLGERLTVTEHILASGRPTVPSTLELELDTNPFLRCDHSDVVSAASQHAGGQLQPGVETFAEIRRWKDGYRD